MPLNIPMPKSIADYFSEGFDTGLNMYQRAQQNKLQRDQMKAAEDHFQQELALRKAAAARAGANSDLQRQMMEEQLLGLKQSHDPLFKAHQYEALENYWKNRGNPQMQNAPAPSQEMGQGMGMFSPEGMAQAQQQQQAPQMQGSGQGGIDIDAMRQSPMLRAAFKDTFKFDPLAETPEQKRNLDLQSKLEFEKAKTLNKTGMLKDKELIAVNKDLPTLQKSLKGVNQLIQIAKNNPEMFGHGFMPDRYAKTTKLKDFGTWQNLISDAIAGLEQKLSSKGNIVALKMAAQLKPSHAEQREVAIGKLESMKQQLMDSINHSNELLGKEPLKNESVSQDLSKMSDAELMQIAGVNR